MRASILKKAHLLKTKTVWPFASDHLRIYKIQGIYFVAACRTDSLQSIGKSRGSAALRIAEKKTQYTNRLQAQSDECVLESNHLRKL